MSDNDGFDMDNNFEDEDEDEDEGEEEKELETSKLEAEFKETLAKVRPLIKEKLDVAMKALREAENIAEEHGVPFSSGLSPLGQSYYPKSFGKKFSKLDQDVVSDITGTWTEYYGEFYGWEHSAVC